VGLAAHKTAAFLVAASEQRLERVCAELAGLADDRERQLTVNVQTELGHGRLEPARPRNRKR